MNMKERRQHKRLPVIKNLAEPIEISILDAHAHQSRLLPGVLTNLSAGGMVLVLMGPINEKAPGFRLNMHLPGFDRFEVEGKIVWAKPKDATSVVGIQFTKIDKDHAKQITHMAEAYWECEDRIQKDADTVCFHGCSFWDLCEKEVKLKHVPKVQAMGGGRA